MVRMIWLGALIASSAAVPAMPPGPVAARVEATATVRILSAARLRFDGQGSPELPPVRDGVIHDQSVAYPAKLIEFQ